MKNYVGNEVVYVSEEGIVIVHDDKTGNMFESIALKEVSMNYGIIITEDYDVIAYSEDKESHDILNYYWNIMEDTITTALDKAEGIEDFLDISIAILVAVTKSLREQGIGGEEDLIA